MIPQRHSRPRVPAGDPDRRSLRAWVALGIAMLIVVIVADAAVAAPRLSVASRVAAAAPGSLVQATGRVKALRGSRRSVRVLVEERLGSRWRRRGTARLTSRLRFAVRWRVPATSGRHTVRLRLVRSGKTLSRSATWKIQVAPRVTPGSVASSLVAPAPGATPSSGGAAAGGGTGTRPAPGAAPPAAAAETLVVAPAAVEQAPEPGQPGVLRLSGDVPVEVGDVLAAGVGDATPVGFLVRATSVQRTGGDTVVGTTQATLQEALPEGSFDESFTLTDARRMRRSFRRSLACADDGDVVIDGDFDLGSPQVDFEAGWGLLSGLTAKATASVTATANASASASGTASCEVGPVKILERKLAPVSFTIGPLPVVIVPEIEIELSGMGEVNAAIATSVDASLTARAGLELDDGELSPIAELDKSFSFSPPDPTANAKVGATLSSELEVSLYGVGGPDFAFNAGLEANADLDEEPWWWLDAPISFTAGFEVDVLGIDKGPLTVYEKRFRLAEAPSRLPLYRIVAGRFESSMTGDFACSAGQTGCTGVTTSQRQTQSADTAFTVAAPNRFQGRGDFEVTPAIERWDQAYSYASTAVDGECRSSTSEVDSGPVRHGGGTSPSRMYLLLGHVGEPEDGRPATQPRIELRGNASDRGNYTLNQPTMGVGWHYSPPAADHSLVHTAYRYTYGSGCPGPGTSTHDTDQDALARTPFDPDYFPFGGGEISRNEYEEPLVYGTPRCVKNRCVTRVSGVSGFTSTRTKPVPGTASVRRTWWFDVESCFGCASE